MVSRPPATDRGTRRRAAGSPESAVGAPSDLGRDRRDDRMEVADHRVVGGAHDRRVRIVVDRQDVLGRLAADDVLDRAADPAGDVEVRARSAARSGRSGRACGRQPALVTTREPPTAPPSRPASSSRSAKPSPLPTPRPPPTTTLASASEMRPRAGRLAARHVQREVRSVSGHRNGTSTGAAPTAAAGTARPPRMSSGRWSCRRIGASSQQSSSRLPAQRWRVRRYRLTGLDRHAVRRHRQGQSGRRRAPAGRCRARVRAPTTASGLAGRHDLGDRRSPAVGVIGREAVASIDERWAAGRRRHRRGPGAAARGRRPRPTSTPRAGATERSLASRAGRGQAPRATARSGTPPVRGRRGRGRRRSSVQHPDPGEEVDDRGGGVGARADDLGRGVLLLRQAQDDLLRPPGAPGRARPARRPSSSPGAGPGSTDSAGG